MLLEKQVVSHPIELDKRTTKFLARRLRRLYIISFTCEMLRFPLPGFGRIATPALVRVQSVNAELIRDKQVELSAVFIDA